MLCDVFRHPANFAKYAINLSGTYDDKFNFGFGSCLWPAEFARFDVVQ